MTHIVKILSIGKITHDVLLIVTEKPSGYNFVPGQATDVCVNKDGWKEEKRAFTFTSLPSDDHLEFTTKTYPDRKGVTNQLLQSKKDDELILHDVFGDISYQGEGIFIAGGAGITPFISIFRDLQSKNAIADNKLIFANKTKADIIHEELFRKLLGKNFVNILSDEKVEGCANGYINETFLKTNISEETKHIYLCGPPPMMEAVEKIMDKLGVNLKIIVKEAF